MSKEIKTHILLTALAMLIGLTIPVIFVIAVTDHDYNHVMQNTDIHGQFIHVNEQIYFEVETYLNQPKRCWHRIYAVNDTTKIVIGSMQSDCSYPSGQFYLLKFE